MPIFRLIVLLVILDGPPDQALYLGDLFFSRANYDAAITEYKRFRFFAVDSSKLSYAYYRIGLAYRNQRRWQRAVDAHRASVESAPNDSIQDERKVDLAVTHIGYGNYSCAEVLLLRLENFSRFPNIRRRASFLRAVNYIYQFRWKDGRAALGEDGTGDCRVIDSLLAVGEEFRYKSPRTALILSTIIPGAGQIYTGEFSKGINILLLNGAIGYLMIYRLIRHDYLNAIIIYYLLFRRYYLGAKWRAAMAAREYNLRKNRKLAEEVLKQFR